jgi:hypothetical protein
VRIAPGFDIGYGRRLLARRAQWRGQVERPLVRLSAALLDGDPDRRRLHGAVLVRHRLCDRDRSALAG